MMRFLNRLFVFAALSLSLSMHGQTQLNTATFNQIDSLLSIQQRHTVVFIHTSWCKYCHQMKNTTFANQQVVDTLNQHFYFISLDAESKEDIHYQGYTFTFKPNGANTGIHQLAEQLATVNGKINYPTLCVLNSNNEIVFQYAGFMQADELIAVLKKIIE